MALVAAGAMSKQLAALALRAFEGESIICE